MDFRDIAIKNFKGNMRRYLSYFLCNSFAILILFMYSTLMYSKELKTSPQIEESLPKVLVLPNVVLIFFSIMFITYSYSVFMKSRKREFGLFMNLGMSIWDIRKLIFVENALIAAASIAFGILSGTIFSRLFFLIITRLIGLTDISFHINLDSYIYSVGIFTGIFLFAVLTTIIATSRYEIVNLLKADRAMETNRFRNPIFAVAGIIILLSSLFVVYKWFNGEGGLLMQCTIGFIVGLYMTISQLGGLILSLAKKRKDSYYNNLILMTNLNSKFNQAKKIIFIIAIMTVVVIFINGFYLSLVLSAEKIALKNNPFDAAFVQMTNKNKTEDRIIDSVISDSKNEVVEHKVIEFADIDRKILISQDQINLAANSSFNVRRGSYIKLIQVDEYSEKEKLEIYNNEMKFPDKDVLAYYSNQEYIFKLLFNGPSYLFTRCIILNNEDYNSIKTKNSRVEIGKLELLNFKDWKETQPLVNRLEESLNAFNQSYPDQRYLKVESKIGTYNENKQGTKVLFYLLSLLGIFFFIATSIVLFLKLFSELDNEKSKYKKMHKIGITEDEIRKNIGREFIALFFAGPLMGIPIAIIYTIAFSKDTQSMTPQLIGCNLIISTIFILFEVIYYFVAKNLYSNEIIETL